MAFPCISRGIHRFPEEVAAQTAIATVKAHSYGGDVTFCCALEEDYADYKRLLEQAS